jgi:hypothetical protein
MQMKRKTGHTMIDLDEKVKVIHLNVASGYVTYLEEAEGDAKVKGIALDKAAHEGEADE